MTKNQSIVAAFRAAKRHLSETYYYIDGCQHICRALDTARDRGEASQNGVADAQQVIWERLTPAHYTLEDWLDAHIGEEAVEGAPFDSVQQYRHRWVDALIEEFSK